MSEGGPKVRMVQIDEGSDGQRIDNFLLKTMKGVPRSRIYRCVRKGEVRVNGKRVKAEQRLVLGDEVRIPPVRMSNNEVASASDGLLHRLERALLYEDDYLMILNKPTGLAVHGGSGISLGAIEALRQLRPNARYLELAHRLDRDTSGCLMVCKKPSILKKIQKLLHSKDQLEKHYLCIVHGKWSKRKQQVNLPLVKNVLASGERISRVQADGKRSVTEYSVLEQSATMTLLAARPVTGRTHQIRVHCAASGHPIIGDTKYGDGDKQPRLMLHAHRLVLPVIDQFPGLDIEAPVDEYFRKLSSQINKQKQIKTNS